MAASTGGIIAGKAFVLIEAIDKTGTVLSKVGKRMKDFGSGLSSLGASLLTKGLFAAAPMALATKVFMGFDDAMRRVEARSSGTADEMQRLRDQAKELGRTTSSTAQQIGDMMGNLAQKGFSRSQIFEMVPNVRNLAQAAGTGDAQADAVNAADLVSGTIRAFGLSAGESGRLADVFATAVNASNFTLLGLVDSMATAAPIAKQYNLSVEQTVATLAGMTNVNIGAAEAGYAFRNMLLNASSAAKRADFNLALMAETGKQIQFIDADDNLLPLPKILDDVGRALAGVGSAKRGELFELLFGKRAITGANAVADAMANTSDGFSVLFDKLSNSAGKAEETARLMDSGSGGAFRRFLSAVEGVALAIIDSLDPVLSQLGDSISRNLESVSRFVEANRVMVLYVAGAIAGVIALGGAMIFLGPLVKLAGTALMGIATLLSPTGLILAGIAAAVLALPGFGEAAQAAFDKVKDVLGIVGELALAGEFGEIGKLAMEGIEASFDWAMATIKANWDIWLDDMSKALYRIIGEVWDWWSDKVTKITNKLLGTEEVEMQARLNADELKKAQNAVRWLEELRKKTLEYKETRDESKAVFRVGNSGRTADLRGKSDAELNSDLNAIEKELEAAKRHLEWRTGTGLGGVPNTPAEFGTRADTSVADRESERSGQQAAADAAASRLAEILDRGKKKASEARAAREDAELSEAADALATAWLDEWDRVEAEEGAKLDDWVSQYMARAFGETEGGGIAEPVNGPGSIAALDSGIRSSANEAIERGSIEAARVVAGDQMAALAEQQLTVLEQIAANTSPANQPSDDEEAV